MQKNKFSIWQLLQVLLYGGTVYTVLIFCTIWHFAMSTPSVPADCALVFGSVVHGNSQPGPGIRRRVEAAARLYAQGNVVQLFMAGGVGRIEQQSEAEVMRQYAMQLLVPSNAITIEGTSTSTLENIQLSFQNKALQDCSHVVAVSDGYHLARIALITKLMGINTISLQPTTLPTNNRFFVYSAIREAVALPYVLLQMALLN